MRLSLFAAVFALLAFGCRSDGDPMMMGGDDAPPVDAPPGTVDTRIQDVQSDSMAPGTAVTVKGVVVTAIDTFGNRTGDLFVQEPDGGEFSGVKVFGAPLDQVSALQVGDLVDISGAVKDEFALTSDTSGRKVTELKPVEGGTMTIIKVGTGTVPAPATVDAVAIAALDVTARQAEWEKWEGVLIKVVNARQIAAMRTFGSMPGPDSTEFRITGFARVQSVLAELPASNAFGTCYASITGIGDYFFNDLVLPRTTEDVVSGGAGCTPMPTSVVALQSAAQTPEVADLMNVVVTGVDLIPGTGTNAAYGFWVADAAQAAPNNGVYVFTGTTMPPYTVGQRVNVKGGVSEFDLGSMGNPAMGNTITQLTETSHSAATGTVVPTPVAVGVDVAGHIDNGEPYEGVLFTIQAVKVTNPAAGGGRVELTSNGGAKIQMSKDAFNFTAPAMDACLNVTGLGSVAIFDDLRTINPRSVADIVPTTGCN